MVQVVLLRELLVGFLGNELSIGVMLGEWLLFEALGSWGLGRFSRDTEPSVGHYIALQALVALLLPLAVAQSRIVRSLGGFVPGQGAGLPSIAFFSFVVLAPLALCGGAQFTLGCKILSTTRGAHVTIGWAYVLESAGAVTGGMAATFLFVPRVSPVISALTIGALNLLSGLLLVIGEGPPTRLYRIGRPALIAMALVGTAFLLVSPTARIIDAATLKARWKGYQLIVSENSVYGNIAVIEQAGEVTFFVDGVATVTSPPDFDAARTLVHVAFLAKGDPKRVLVIGGGAGGVLSEILRYDVDEVVYVEQDPLLIQLLRDHPTDTTRYEFSDPRVKIEGTDGRRFLTNTGEAFDVILMNLPYPSSLNLNRFYTVEFLSLAGSKLASGGVLAFPVPGATGYLSMEERKMNGCMLQSLERSFAHVRAVPGAPSIFLASNDLDLSRVSPEVLCERSRSRGLDLIVPCQLFTYLLNPAREEWYHDSLEAVSARTNRDLRPCAVFYSLAYWTSIFSPRLLWAVNAIEAAGALPVLASICAFALICICLQTRLRARGLLPIPFLVASTGFFGMGISVAVILAFQSFFGYLYQEIGLVLTAFMLGLSLGGSAMNRLIADGRSPGLAWVEGTIIIFCPIFVLVVLPLGGVAGLRGYSALAKILMLGMNAVSGLLVGAEFSLSSRARLVEERRLSRAAGAVYAWDLIGAVIGSLALSIMLIPLVGVATACLSIMALKLLSLALLVTSH